MANVPITPLPFPPNLYDAQYFNEMIRNLNWYFRQIQNPGPMIASTLQLTGLPTSATGLPSGSVWDDSGTLKIVP